ncbi:restriction endonuclease [Chryseobacterium sp. WX]|uniref:restriction endonuclease n=1 Tax=Chryseobacterium sp. WX TaxID=3031803 RepID=UPI00240987C8|nr:restriction endonuclease [Chryseobacterium sp. WX]WFB69104.1 restriction endonuclease [Chryseobacterium sp. WX]
MKQRNTLNWKTYESITKYIYETLKKEFKVNIEGYGNDCKVKGKSGVQHQIDVLISESNDVHTFRTAVECKYWNKKINKDTVMKLWAIIADSDIEEGIIVSKKGYTNDAQQFASHYNIKLVQLREIGSEDHDLQKELEFGILNLCVKSTLSRPKVLEIAAKTIDGDSIILSEKQQYQIFIENHKGIKNKLSDAIMNFKNELHNEKPFFVIAKAYDFTGSILHHNNIKDPISSINFIGILTIQNDSYNKEYTLVDKVWLIMKSIFEKRTFTISEFGYISENLDLDIKRA